MIEARKKMGRLMLGLLLCVALASCGNDDEGTASVRISTITPRSISGVPTYQDLNGNAVLMADYAGKHIFLNYWATWCAPCIKEIPSIDRAAAILEEDGFVFLLASDESIEKITDFVADHDFEGNFIKLNEFFGSTGVEAVPSSFLLDENGDHVHAWLGDREWDSPEILAELRALAGVGDQ